MNVIQRKKRMTSYLLSTIRYGKQLNRMKINDNTDYPIHAGKLLSSYRMKVGIGLILLNNIHNNLDNKSLKRAYLIDKQIYELLKDAESTHYYNINKRIKRPVKRIPNATHNIKIIPIKARIIKQHSPHNSKYILKRAVSKLRKNLNITDILDNYFSNVQGELLVFIIGLVVVLFGLLAYLLYEIIALYHL